MRLDIRYVTRDQFDFITATAQAGGLPYPFILGLKLCWATGIRVSECFSAKGRTYRNGSRMKDFHGLRPRDMLPGGHLLIDGKNSARGNGGKHKQGVVFVSDPAVWEELVAFAKGKDPEANLFFPGAKNGPDHVGYRVRQLRQLLPPELKAFSPRWLRHSFAIHAVRNGVDIVTVQRQMRHESLTMTARYLRFAPANEDALRSAFARKPKEPPSKRHSCPSCGFAWSGTCEGVLDVESRMGVAMRRR